MKHTQFIFFLMIFLLSCSNKLDKSSLEEYCLNKDNGVIKSVSAHGVVLTSWLKPNDLIVCQYLHHKEEVSTQMIDSCRKKYEDFYYFNLSISQDKNTILSASKSYAEYSEFVKKFSFQMSEYIYFTDADGKKFELYDYSYLNTFGMSTTSDFLLVLDKRKLQGSNIIKINISEFGLGIGTQVLKFNVEDIIRVPKLDFKNFKH